MKKKIFCILLAILTVFLIFQSSVLTVNAETFYCGVHEKTHDTDDLGVMEKLAFDMSSAIYGGNLFLADTGAVKNDGLITMEELLSFDISSSEFTALWDVGKSVYSVLKTVGILLLVVYVMVEAMNRAMNDLSNFEYFVKCLMKVVIGVIIINNGYDIAGILLNMGTVVYDFVASNLGGFGQYSVGQAVCDFEELNDAGNFVGLLYIITVALPWLVLQFAKIVTYAVAWIRIFDILMRIMFAPIGMSDIMVGGLDSHGFFYLRRLGASCIQGAIMLAIVQTQSIVQSAIGYGPIILTMLMATLSITLIWKSNDIANEIMGV